MRRRRSEQGQISMMVGIMMMTFILLFAFVINTGMLVHAKINLQNAADLAAYAGAAVQARQMTQISYINYEMRRQWKKLLFRLYVIGNMSQDLFPRSQGGTGQMQYVPNRNNPSVDYKVPATCVIFNPEDNFCHLTTLPAIKIPAANFMDQVAQTLRGQLEQIEQIRQDNCKGIGLTNKLLNIYWLFNADPNMTQFDNGAASSLGPDQIKALNAVKGLAYGLGIVPRELILKWRIDTLKDYLNQPGNLSLNKSSIDGFLNGIDPMAKERSIQAFYSAFYTLGNHLYPPNSISLDELLPTTVFDVKPIAQKFDTYTIDLKNATAGCEVEILPISVNRPLTVGVYKDPNILTYYAVRLKAKARVLFSPFGDMDLKAYAAAQPFGSRIGPPPGAVQFATPTEVNPQFVPAEVLQSLVKQVPNLAIEKGKPLSGRGQGWDNQLIVGSMFQRLSGTAGASVSKTISSNNMERAYRAAMAPSPWEGDKYNIINDEGNDPFVRNFDTNEIASFWAPVFPPDKRASASEEIRNGVNEFFLSGAANAQGNVGSSGSGPNPLSLLQNTLQAGLDNYITQVLPKSGGENGEGINVFRMSNPFTQIGPNGTPEQISGDPSIWMQDPVQFKTSWSMPNDARFRAAKRVGYSVKFVSLDSLREGGHRISTNGYDSWTNSISDSESSADLPFLKH